MAAAESAMMALDVDKREEFESDPRAGVWAAAIPLKSSSSSSTPLEFSVLPFLRSASIILRAMGWYLKAKHTQRSSDNVFDKGMRMKREDNEKEGE